ncbi:MAG TPA: methionine synthase, partial [Opitutae bacterium]|nr:methionine synthase [Opitutae bacterium]
GDVHDIGKNIVGVVLACNNWEVIDLGVMVSCDKILEAVRKHNADVLGLSGLITPSLDEMIHNAQEMQKGELKIPLLIGGATTSRAHTAIKIAPHYEHGVVQVADASLVVNVCNDLMQEGKRENFVKELKDKQEKIRIKHENKESKLILPLADSRAKGISFDWNEQEIAEPLPERLGLSQIKAELKEVLQFFDWSPFFWAWELRGKYPDIFNHKKFGDEAKKLYDCAQELLDRILKEKSFQCDAVVGLWPAHSVGDDIEVFQDIEKDKPLGTFRFLRRQQPLPNQPHHCLADFVAPKDSKVMDYLGAFAVCAGKGVEDLAQEYEDKHDDYSAIMIKALGDRFAEAMAEYTHKKVREWWQYGINENLDNQALIREEYQGIRPASGYPCQPDHTEKDLIWELLSVSEKIGLELTESRAMTPGCSVSGLYFSHPKAAYFNVGGIDQDQVEDYARRKGWSREKALKWLGPNLAFDP